MQETECTCVDCVRIRLEAERLLCQFHIAKATEEVETLRNILKLRIENQKKRKRQREQQQTDAVTEVDQIRRSILFPMLAFGEAVKKMLRLS